MANTINSKEVSFLTDTLLTAEVGGKIYVSVRAVANALGFTKGQYARQLSNVQQDIVISKGVSNLVLPTNGGSQEFIVLDIEFLPLWLAKISITPKLQQEHPDVVDKLVAYQLKAKDVLYEAFFPKQTLQKTPAEMLVMYAEQFLQQERKLTEIENRQKEQQIRITDNEQRVETLIHHMSDVPDRAKVTRKINELSRTRGWTQQVSWHEVYYIIRSKYGVDIQRRVQNQRQAIQEARRQAGKPLYQDKTVASKVNGLDILEEQGLLSEAYEAIVGLITA